MAADTDFGSLDDVSRILAADAQTSGGLLLAVAPDRAEALAALLRDGGDEAAVIGHITTREPDAASIRLT